MSTPESRVKAQINRALKTLPRCYKFMPVQSGLGAKTLDYLICIRGFFVGLEAKAPGKSYTPLQEVHKHEIEAAGGTVFLVDGPISLEIAMEALRGHRPCP